LTFVLFYDIRTYFYLIISIIKWTYGYSFVDDVSTKKRRKHWKKFTFLFFENWLKKPLMHNSVSIDSNYCLRNSVLFTSKKNQSAYSISSIDYVNTFC